MPDVVNRYNNQDISVLTEIHSQMDNLTSRSDRDGKPFARLIDLWWIGLAVGVRMQKRTAAQGPTTKIIDGTIFSSDPWRLTHLELLALEEEGAAVLDSPAQVIRIASEYANTGLTVVLATLLGEAEPTLSLMAHIETIGAEAAL